MEAKKPDPAYMDYLERTRRNHFWVGGEAGQLKIRNLRIGVAGLGGMGSNIAEIFARLGVGYLRISDPDTIDRTNINRQVIANEETVGEKKALASAAELHRIAKDLQLDVHTDGIQEHNADQFVRDLDVIINEIDVLHIDKQLLLLAAARRNKIPVYTTLVVGLGIHLYKYDAQSPYSGHEFLTTLIDDPSAENLIDRLGGPLPSYLQGKTLAAFTNEIKSGCVPIFGASTYLGQSLLAIRVLYDQGCIPVQAHVPVTPSLPEFLVLDPLTLELKKAKISANGKIDFI